MLKVLFTVDTEIWCGGWNNLDAAFPEAFKRYVYGPTPQGDYALPGLLHILGEHGLTGVFFVESLFATRFGVAPLQELVGLIKNAGHEIQLHLHPEWVDEALEPVLSVAGPKRPLLRDFSLAEQTSLIATGLDLLQGAGAQNVNAFRAGSYALDSNTLRALAANGLFIDSSYNAGYTTGVGGVASGRLLTQPECLEGVSVFPVTAYQDRGHGHLRHLQLTACSFAEISAVLERAVEAGWTSVVIVAHNFELLNAAKDRVDRLVLRRFRRLCRFLEANSDRFHVCGFHDVDLPAQGRQPPPIRLPLRLTGARYIEQIARRFI